ncbi:MAG TPA: lactate utilization protein C [Oxalobacteraceae bacterium]|nr:lactate utilization protein C [Oxalobacteraceae bacterium]
MNARERILARLRAAPQSAAPSPPALAAFYAASSKLPCLTERIGAFKKNIEAFRAEVHQTTADEWPSLLATLCRDKQLGNLLYAPGMALAKALAGVAGMPRLVAFEQEIEAWKEALFEDIDASLSLARGAIAETGSLIIWPGPDEPRTLSLVPAVHFVLLDARLIHADLFSAMTQQAWAADMPTNALLVSGPSKTADIQQTLAYGAHGPKELIVLLMMPQEAP